MNLVRQGIGGALALRLPRESHKDSAMSSQSQGAADNMSEEFMRPAAQSKNWPRNEAQSR
jgi:hypothetical protein